MHEPDPGFRAHHPDVAVALVVAHQNRLGEPLENHLESAKVPEHGKGKKQKYIPMIIIKYQGNNYDDDKYDNRV